MARGQITHEEVVTHQPHTEAGELAKVPRAVSASQHVWGGGGSILVSAFSQAVKSTSHSNSSFFSDIVIFSMTQGRKCNFILRPGNVF